MPPNRIRPFELTENCVYSTPSYKNLKPISISDEALSSTEDAIISVKEGERKVPLSPVEK